MASIIIENNIKCAQCSAQSKYTSWHLADFSTEPHLRDMILDDSLFNWKCPRCSHTDILRYDLSVYDPQKDYLITLISGNQSKEMEYPQEFQDFEKPKRLRLVKKLIDLKEKIRIFEDGLDDRALEAYKCFLLSTAEIEEGSKAPDSFVYERRADQAFHLLAFSGEECLGVFETPTTVYNSMSQDLEAAIGSPNDQSLTLVDMQWALKAFEAMS